MNPFLEEESSYDVAVEALRSDPKRTDLIRMNPQKPSSDGRTLEGYFAVFNQRSKINSPAESPVPFWETMGPKSLSRTVDRQQGKLQLLFNHGFDPSIGKKPLGTITDLSADEIGGFVRARISDVSYATDIATLIADGAIDGMSFRAKVVKDEWSFPTFREAKSGSLPERVIHEAALEHELGPVTFPAYEATTVGVRSLSDFEEWDAANAETRDAIRALLRDAVDPVHALEQVRGYSDSAGPPIGPAGDSTKDSADGPSEVATIRLERRRVARMALVRARGVQIHGNEAGDASDACRGTG